MKLFGDEVKFTEIRQENVDQLEKDFSDLLLGKKDRIEYPGLGKIYLYVHYIVPYLSGAGFGPGKRRG